MEALKELIKKLSCDYDLSKEEEEELESYIEQNPDFDDNYLNKPFLNWAADGGHDYGAMAVKGRDYLWGICDVKQDIQKGISMIEEAVDSFVTDNGYVQEAYKDYGYLKLIGCCVPKDESKAYELLSGASEYLFDVLSGIASSMMLFEGIGVEADISQALKNIVYHTQRKEMENCFLPFFFMAFYTEISKSEEGRKLYKSYIQDLSKWLMMSAVRIAGKLDEMLYDYENQNDREYRPNGIDIKTIKSAREGLTKMVTIIFSGSSEIIKGLDSGLSLDIDNLD